MTLEEFLNSSHWVRRGHACLYMLVYSEESDQIGIFKSPVNSGVSTSVFLNQQIKKKKIIKNSGFFVFLFLRLLLYCLKLAEIFLVHMLVELQWHLVFGGLLFPSSARIPFPPFLQRLIDLKGHAMPVWKL